MPSQNQQDLAGGTAFHLRHGRQVIQAGLIRVAGWLIFFIAMTLLVIGLALQWLNAAPALP